MIRATDDWPPKYTLEFKVRQKLFYRTIKKKEYIYGSKMFYKDYPADFINDWCLTYDPRNAATSKPTIMPFILFKRQKECPPLGRPAQPVAARLGLPYPRPQSGDAVERL